MSDSHRLEENLALELIDKNLYRSTRKLWHPPMARGIFGGAVIAQALSAALKTVDSSLHVHSLHSYFVLAGDSSIPVIYSVEIVRNGRSFATRTVRSIQRGAVISVLTASFQKPEPSPLHHCMSSPIHLVPEPESIHSPSPREYAQTVYQGIVKKAAIPTKQTRFSPLVAKAKAGGSNGDASEEVIKSLSEEFAARPIEFRYVHDDQVKTSARTPQPTEYRQYCWFKANGEISDDPRMHAVGLAYASDHDLLSTAVGAHKGQWEFSDVSVMVSLDHILYFHDDFKVDDWLLFESVSPWSGASRGLSFGYIFTRDGRHVATCVQEGLLRLSDKAKERGAKL